MSDLTTSLYALAQPFKTKVSQLSEKSLLYQHYPTLKKATSTDPGDTPGYVYDELVQLSYSDVILATQLAIYLADCLDSCASKIRTAKTIHHLVRKGSRQFRKTLRSEKDDILRKTGNFSDPVVAKIINETRVILFDEELVNQDDSMSEEKRPEMTSLSGMGATSGSSGQGFGNTPINKENFGHKVLDMIDKTVHIPDEREQVLKSCLAQSAVGDYLPVQAPTMKASVMMKTSKMSTSTSSFLTGKKHTPGKAGGGWESSDDEDEILSQGLSEVSLESPMKPKECDVMIESACEAFEDDENLPPEIQELRDFCSESGLPSDLFEIEDCFNKLLNLDHLVVLEQLKFIMEDEKSSEKVVRSMLILECYLRSNFVKASDYESIFSDVLTTLSKSCEASTTAINKATKLKLIISRLNK